MKKILLLVSLLLTFSALEAQDLLLSEDFNYPLNDNLNKYNWKPITTSTDNLIKVIDGLNNKDYPAIGGAALLNNTGQDVIRSFSKISSDRIFVGFQLNIKSTSGACANPLNYFMFLSAAEEPDKPLLKFSTCGGSSGYYKGLFVMNAENKIIANMPQYIVEPNHTYNFVVSYDLTGNDAGLVVLNIDGDNYTFHQDEIKKNNLKIDNLSNIVLSQSDKEMGSTVIIDRIRIGKTWGSVVPCTNRYTKFTSHFCTFLNNGAEGGDTGVDRKIQLTALSSSELTTNDLSTYRFNATPNYTHLSIEVPEGFLVKVGDNLAVSTGLIPLNSYYDCSVPVKIFLVGDSKKIASNGNLVAGKAGTYSGNVIIRPAGGYCNAVMWSIKGVINEPILSTSNNVLPSFNPTLFPIPNNGKLNLLINEKMPLEEMDVTLADNSGKFLYAETGQWEKIKAEIEGVLSTHKSTVPYYLTIKQGNQIKTFKLVQE